LRLFLRFSGVATAEKRGDPRCTGDPAPSLVGDEDVLLLGERQGGVRTELPAEAGLLVAAEGSPVADRRVGVDAEVAGLDAPRDPQPAARAAGEDAPSQSASPHAG